MIQASLFILLLRYTFHEIMNHTIIISLVRMVSLIDFKTEKERLKITMVSPAAKPQPPTPRSEQNKNTTSTNSHPNSSSTSSAKPVGKPSLFARYNALSLKVKLYIWITTAGVAWLADSISDRIFEQNMIDAEASRRVEIELRKMKEAELQLKNEK